MKQADLWLYVGVAVSGTVTTSFQTDEAMHYIPPELLFFLRMFFAATGAGFLAAKMYRSTTFAENQKKDEETQRWTRTGLTEQPNQAKVDTLTQKTP
jgi:hypothetical protein